MPSASSLFRPRHWRTISAPRESHRQADFHSPCASEILSVTLAARAPAPPAGFRPSPGTSSQGNSQYNQKGREHQRILLDHPSPP